jgi:aldose 1-epimerase
MYLDRDPAINYLYEERDPLSWNYSTDSDFSFAWIEYLKNQKSCMKIINEQQFKGTYKGKNVSLYTLKNSKGVIAQITNFGAKIVSIYVPDRNGKFADVLQGYETFDEWITGFPFFGAICGRYANRIANGKFSIDGVEYHLPINNGPNCLHGGPDGFNEQVFDVQSSSQNSVTLRYLSKDGEAGFPGNFDFTVHYTLTDSNELVLNYHGKTDKTTHVNICSHGFFNLAGCDHNDITGQTLMINSKQYTPVNQVQIPTGEIASVVNTPMDFTSPHVIGERIDEPTDQLKYGGGYDHNWILDKPLNELGLAAIYADPTSGRKMEVYTTQPGLQVYTSNWHENLAGKHGAIYSRRSAICLEAQHYPDSPNQDHFPSTLLRPGDIYEHSCIYKFLNEPGN